MCCLRTDINHLYCTTTVHALYACTGTAVTSGLIIKIDRTFQTVARLFSVNYTNSVGIKSC